MAKTPKPHLLKTSKRHCFDCPLLGLPHVKNWGVPTEVIGKKPKVLFVAEAPGGTENDEGRPLIGMAGTLLRRVWKKVAGSDSEYALGNTIRCRPSDNNKLPSDRKVLDAIVSRCSQNIRKDVQEMHPEVLVLLGGTAIQAFVEDAPSTINGARQKVHVVRIGDRSYRAIATYHPSYIARHLDPNTNQPYEGDGRKIYNAFFDDLTKARKLADGEDIEESQQPKSEKDERHTGRRKGSSFLGGGGTPVELDSFRAIKSFLRRVRDRSHPYLAYDVETSNGVNIAINRVAAINMAVSPKEGYTFLWHHPKNPCTPREMKILRKRLIQIFTSKEVGFERYIAHNAPFDMAQTFNEFGVWPINRPWWDTMILEHNFDCNRPRNQMSLDSLTRDRLGIDPWDPELSKMVASGKIKDMTLKQLSDYGAHDVYSLIRLAHVYEEKGHAEKRWSTLCRYMDGLHYGVLAVAFMERTGAPIDIHLLQALLAKNSLISEGIQDLEAQMKKHPDFISANDMLHGKVFRGKAKLWGTPWIFDPAKNEHLKTLLVDVIDVNPKPKVSSKTGKYNFDKKFFEQFDGDDENKTSLGLLLEWRKLLKLRNSYVKSLPKYYNSKTGRIHAHFGLAHTQTGRLNSEKPNFQQMPKPTTPAKRAVKNIVCADDDKVLVNSDFSQAEVRYVAEVSKCSKLLEIFDNIFNLRENFFENPTVETKKRLKTEGDIHLNTAGMMYEIKLTEVKKSMRDDTKGIVFGLIYGMGRESLSIKLKCTKDQADVKIEQFFKPFGEVRQWLEKTKARAERDHYVDCIFGRRRHLPDFEGGDDEMAAAGRRKSTNTPIQNAASDHNLMAAGRLVEYIIRRNKPWEIVALVHDSILGHIPVEDIEEYVLTVKKFSTSTKWLERTFDLSYDVKFIVDFEVGRRWAEMINWDGSHKTLKLMQDAFTAPWNRKYKTYGKLYAKRAA